MSTLLDTGAGTIYNPEMITLKDKIAALMAERDEEIRALRHEDPVTWTYRALAKSYGISRSRACQICLGRMMVEGVWKSKTVFVNSET
jgi:hypothetical protein